MRLTDIMELEDRPNDASINDEVESRVRALHRYLRNARKREKDNRMALDAAAIMGFKEDI